MRSHFILLLVLFVFTYPAFSNYPVGEKLEYKAAALGFIPVGTVYANVSTGSYQNIPTFTFDGRCYGNYLVYLADVRLKSELSQKTDQALYHHIEQFGTDRRGRKLLFDWSANNVKYFSLGQDTNYYQRTITKITPDVWDVFGAGMHIRPNLPTEIGQSVDLKLIERNKVYHLRFKAVEQKLLQLKGLGIFKAVKIKFNVVGLKKDQVFKGLLNLDKDLAIWIEKTTKTPLVMETTVPFGFVRPKISLTLQKWHAVKGFEPVYYSQKDLETFNLAKKN